MTPRTDLTDLAARLTSIQTLMIEQIAPNYAGDAAIADLWQVLTDFAETVDTWRESEGHDGTRD